MPWKFLDVRILLLLSKTQPKLRVGNVVHYQSSPASLAYTLLGGFVVAVSAMLLLVAQTDLKVFKYNLISLVIKERVRYIPR
jgi:hypothetical protein